MENANLVNDPITVDTGMDSIVIKKNIEAIRGGKTPDVTGYALPIVKAGHVVIMETENKNTSLCQFQARPMLLCQKVMSM